MKGSPNKFLAGLKASETRADWWDDLSVTQQQMIKSGMKDIDSGNVLSSSQFWNALKNG